MSLLSRLAVQAARAYGILSSADKTKVVADYLVVAGGGAGGVYYAGGGGAGGMLNTTTTLSLLTTYTVTVGAGGVGSGTYGVGASGSNSVISGTGLTTITSTGGGGGGGNGSNGANGGSGGGASNSATPGTGTSGQGNNGGDDNGTNSSGGGGGAGAVGGNGVGSTGGAGGAGATSSISGSSVTYAGGGGGYPGGTGGSGGGGNYATSGTANTGGGGGAWNGTGNAGSGGSGIVIISYTSATPKFVGGTITTSGGKQIHTFTSSGTLSPITPITASYLVVAGGGSGGGEFLGGGGGAGGLLTGSTTIYSGATYVVTVGAGGAQVATANGNNGSNSVLSGTGLTTITSTGGGGGGSYSGSAGQNGGSGGGQGALTGGSTGPGTGISGQGFAGGNGAGGPGYGAGGGGGAGAVGGNATTTLGGSGGVGVSSSISGTATFYAGGGGGSAYGGGGGTAGAGGNGGGGAGGTGNGTSGTQNTGGGGGGADRTTVNSGAGGSGIVIISYAGSQVFNGGLVTTSGGNTIHTFTSSGALTPLTNNLNNSLRFRSSASAYLNRTPTVAGNRKTYTFSAWVKRGALNGGGSDMCLFNAGTTSPNYDGFRIKSDTISFYQGGAVSVNIESTQVFRDVSAWYHLVLAVDTTQATAANRVKIYVNGNQVTAFGTANYPAQNAEAAINNTLVHNIAAQYANTSSSAFFDGYMTDINFIDGQALEPYYFGNNDANGVWKPILYKGTYGTNGFYLTFGNTTSTTTLGYDSSPNGNNWTCNNISLTAGTTYDAMLDVPTNTSATVANYCTANPLDASPSGTSVISNANLTVNVSGSGAGGGYGGQARCNTINFTNVSGKWYWEAFIDNAGTGAATLRLTFFMDDEPVNISAQGGPYTWYWRADGVTDLTSPGTFATNDVVMFAYDSDTGKLWVGKNGTWSNSGVPASGTGQVKTLTALTAYALGLNYGTSGGGTGTASFNFGQRPFAYTPPTGFNRINTFNLPTPTILQGNKYMDATLYTGNGSTQVVVNNAQFKPDFVWVKTRNVGTTDHCLFDAVRGVSKYLNSNNTGAEATYTGFGTTAFNSNGFTVVDNAGGGYLVNGSTGSPTYVGWQWQAGQGTTSNITVNQYGSTPSIASTVSVNTTAGFSVVTYAGNGASGATVGHGLGVAPKMMIVKCRTSGTNSWTSWQVYHASLTNPATSFLRLNETSATYTGFASAWNSTAPTSSVFSVSYAGGAGVNGSGDTFVAYCWAEIAGFSAFGSYTGNGSTDGPFVFTNFLPRWVLIKQSSSAGNSWQLIDTARETTNPDDTVLFPNLSNAEGTGNATLDFLSNGFKVRTTDGTVNTSSSTYIYAAFASNPLKNSNAK